ncbi:Glutathione synthase/RimK-type ligase, ATP-grasp superfamily [Pelagirhabdus alkalitolerans]|uniref:Glutathione synthase/RimK-type ligase, ATP-grasp superfamily n=1 Tax=Pelagirhabdus alkalitolerans TaxID=1612202 RepID=A0A1G6GGX1_9BACI|nr:ATP-grasp fold amidoligase family protein [Pelagirhabdus alkalitolerans]SDB81258.1 Glutathione synthase/RimK-type ligase, ATP-grasp superfamily [Pelagirhabdus alkalitolerans]
MSNETHRLIGSECVSFESQDEFERAYQYDVYIRKLNRELDAIDRNMGRTKSKKRFIYNTITSVVKFKKTLRRLKSIPSMQVKIASLEKKITAYEKHIEETSEQQKIITPLVNQLFDIRDEHMRTIARTIDDRAELIKFIDEITVKKQKSEQVFNQILQFCSQVYKTHQDRELVHLIYQKIVDDFPPSLPPELLVRDPAKYDLTLESQDSFSSSMVRRQRLNQIKENNVEATLDNKFKAYQFVDQFSIRRPHIAAHSFKASEVPAKPNVVIKPMDGAGSRGVYLVYSDNDIIDLKRNERLSAFHELKKQMEQDLKKEWVIEDHWYAEELILKDHYSKESARDIKFYAFYGKVELILEIDRNQGLHYCWWDREGKRVKTGKYDNYLFVGEGVSEDEITMVEKMSKEIPSPFMRIDFLRQNDELVFGEFTPKPGNYADFSRTIDQKLGTAFNRAEVCLNEDLLRGRYFEKYKKL